MNLGKFHNHFKHLFSFVKYHKQWYIYYKLVLMIKWIVTHKGAFNRSATFSLSFPTTSDDVDTLGVSSDKKRLVPLQTGEIWQQCSSHERSWAGLCSSSDFLSSLGKMTPATQTSISLCSKWGCWYLPNQKVAGKIKWNNKCETNLKNCCHRFKLWGNNISWYICCIFLHFHIFSKT